MHSTNLWPISENPLSKGEEAELIWDLIEDGTNPAGFVQIVALIKSVGDAIANFLSTY